ncbi:bifunctional Peptidase M24A [Babesia duncani]|uniref:Methionine aminopeptidase n=1 Tax=Babesia duncani TaxID=323732 RepID=A0AAD9PPD3_9APIC|nr:bifunctional Peptidase M24A [Babesia duncani]KAK2198133.1 bifunctional Peptidase M24A [Babesia duncani]
MGTSVKCSGCQKETTSCLACPVCKKESRVSVFCNQECFTSSWNTHALIHTEALGGTGILDYSKDPQLRKFVGYQFTGDLRPWPTTPMKKAPNHILKPDYALDGIPKSEMSIKRAGLIREYTQQEIKLIRRACTLGRKALDLAHSLIRPGITTDEIDTKVHEFIIQHNAYPSPLNYYKFPKSCCTSVNEVICHGIPDSRPLKEGDIVNVDISVFLNGAHGDLNETFFVGNVDDDSKRVTRAAYESLMTAISKCKPGMYYREIGEIIQNVADKYKVSVVRTYCGHGIGTEFHTLPNVPHYRRNKAIGILKPNHVFTIEPMLNLGTYSDVKWPDDWTAVTRDGKRSAQFEHTLLVTPSGVENLRPLISSDYFIFKNDQTLIILPVHHQGSRMPQEVPLADACKIISPETWQYYMHRDWTQESNFDEIFHLQDALGVKICQVTRARDVSVSLAANKKSQIFEETDTEDNKEENTQQIKQKNGANRMLKLILYDGKEYNIAFEYEPIAALDVFHSTIKNGRRERCCGKVALFNSPKQRRDAFWLTQDNVKLLFEGFVCTHTGDDTQYRHWECMESPSRNSAAKFEITKPDHSPTIDAINYACSQSYTHITTPKVQTGSLQEKQSDFILFFPPESGYHDYSFVSFIYKNGFPANDEAFLAFSQAQLTDFIGQLDKEPLETFASWMKRVNLNHNDMDICMQTEPDSLFCYGILQHAVPVCVSEECNDRGRILALQLADAIVAVDCNLQFQHLSTFDLWLVHFNEFQKPPSVCIFPFSVLIDAFDIVETTSLYYVSKMINSLQGFFKMGTITIQVSQ